MRYARRHKHNGRWHDAGTPYEGPVAAARFLYHRGILEPDGSAMDALVTGPKPKKQEWDAFDAPQEME